MGIKTLIQYVNSLQSSEYIENIPCQAELVIDGSGFMFYILSLLDEKNLSIFSLGGYDLIHEAIEKEIHFLQNQLSLRLKVYFDSSKTKFKNATKEYRRQQMEEKWATLCDCCHNSRIKTYNELPIPPLIKETLLFALKKCNVAYEISQDEEADYIMANYVSQEVDKGHQCYVYALDSDFYLMKNCPFILFGELNKVSFRNSEENISCTVWTRSRLASKLKVSEDMLIEAAILCGNDYTKDFTEQELSRSSRQIKDYESALRYIQSQPAGYQVSSKLPNIQLVINYCRDFYNLNDLSIYPFDSDTESQSDFSLSKEEKVKFVSWLKSNYPTSNNIVLSGKVALDYIGHQLTQNGSPSFQNITKFEYDALRVMLSKSSQLNSKSAQKLMKSVGIPEWSAVSAANMYQNFCKEAYKYFDALSDGNVYSIEKYSPNGSFCAAEYYNYIKSFKDVDTNFQKMKLVSQSKEAEVKKTLKDKAEALPIDQYRDEILAKIRRDRVVIIHGETGCGKSSRIPLFLLNDAKSRNQTCKMMVSQPRRIAAITLMKRLRGQLGDEVGLRLGHGIRDEDSKNTKIFFVTTGYLVRLLAHHPDHFNHHTHLVIDEVHERSIDGDLLCFLAKKLLTTNPSIKIIIMSATIHVDLYKEYFYGDGRNGDLNVLSVGVRRFPIMINYLSDIATLLNIAPLTNRLADKCKSLTNKSSCVISTDFAKDQYAIVEILIKKVVAPGSGALVFVSGIADIVELTERLSSYAIFKVYAMHSDIPLDEQEMAFAPVDANEIKVVIATNAAESSITLPDVDVVICLGTHKSITYDPLFHRVQLVNSFISKASATQRAGRTGRVRPGSVFRLYTQQLYDSFPEHEESEILRMPLQDTILTLRVMLEDAHDFEGVIPVLQQLLEPPDMINVEQSFEYLYEAGLLTEADDSGTLTSCGKFAGIMPVDIRLGKMIAMGVLLGIGSDAVILAAALSMPKTPFRQVSPFIHKDPNEFNEIVKTTFQGMLRFDKGTYSEPIMLLNMLKDWKRLSIYSRDKWCRENGVAKSRMQHFSSSANHLLENLTQTLKVVSLSTFTSSGGGRGEGNILDVEAQINMKHSPSEKINLMKLLLLWSNPEHLLRMKKLKPKYRENYNKLVVNHEEVTKEHFLKVFPKNMKWSFDMSGKKIVDIPLKSMQVLQEAQLPDLLMNTLALCLNGEVTLVWIYCQNSETLLMSYYEEHEEAMGSILDRVEAKGAQQFGETLDIGFITFLIQNPSKKLIKLMNHAQELQFASIGILLPLLATVKVTLSNTDLNRVQLSGIFQNTKFQEYGTEELSFQRIGGQKVLQFYDDEKVSKGHVEDSSIVLHDVPLGLRLVNAIRMSYHDRNMRLKKLQQSGSTADVTSASGSGGDRKKAAVGGQKWSAQKQQTQHRAGVDDDEPALAEDNVIIFQPDCPSVYWEMTSVGSQKDFKSYQCKLNKFSHIGASVFLNKDTLHATCFSTMVVGQVNQIMVCDGITILPPGERWVALALICCSVSIDKVMSCLGLEISEEELEKLVYILEKLDFLTNSQIRYDRQLVENIRELFAEWIEDGEEEEDEDGDSPYDDDMVDEDEEHGRSEEKKAEQMEVQSTSSSKQAKVSTPAPAVPASASKGKITAVPATESKQPAITPTKSSKSVAEAKVNTSKSPLVPSQVSQVTQLSHVQPKPTSLSKSKIPRTHYCGICRAQFNTAGALESHNAAKHPVVAMLFGCSYCDQVFPSAQELNSHEHLQHTRTCPKCHLSAAYRKEDDFIDHVFNCEKNVTNDADAAPGVTVEERGLCVHCGKRFDTLLALQGHVKSKHAAALYTCATCGEACKSKSALQKHEQKQHKAK